METATENFRHKTFGGRKIAMRRKLGIDGNGKNCAEESFVSEGLDFHLLTARVHTKGQTMNGTGMRCVLDGRIDARTRRTQAPPKPTRAPILLYLLTARRGHLAAPAALAL
jgi:hypothetical protein